MSTSPTVRTEPGSGPAARRRVQDLPVGVRIGAVFAVLVVLVGAVTGTAVSQMARLSADTEALGRTAIEPQTYLNGVQRWFQASRARVLEYGMVAPEDRAAILEDRAGFDADVLENIDAYAPYVTDDAAYAALGDAYERYQAAADAIQPTVDAGPTAYHERYVTEVRPLTTEVSDALQALIDRVSADADASIDDAASAVRTASVVLVAVGVAGSLVALLLVTVLVRGLVRNLRRVQTSLEALGDGVLTHATGVTSRDELGEMAASLHVAQDSLRTLVSGVVETAGTVAAAAEELSAANTQVASGSLESSAQAGVVAAAAEQVSRNVQTVAAGAEEMSASIREIAQNAAEAAKASSQAVTKADDAASTVGALGESSKEIGNVVKVITSIAEQTNLLALNATIEAARAGEAGKGFAVVAGEVKELAQESARAAEDIGRRIAANQSRTTSAVGAISEISEIIGAINDYQLTIASAVEEQTATTNEMSRSVTEAATGSGEIAVNITGVAEAVAMSSDVLGQMGTSVEELARLSADLREQVSRFTY
jgi:methyl-accepting chemotaxis protein